MKKNKNSMYPLCPVCGSPMDLRIAQAGHCKGSKFWACSEFPQCLASFRWQSNSSTAPEYSEYDESDVDPGDDDFIDEIAAIEQQDLEDDVRGSYAEDAARADDAGWYYSDEDEDGILVEREFSNSATDEEYEDYDDGDDYDDGEEDPSEASYWRSERLQAATKEAADEIEEHVVRMGGSARVRLSKSGRYSIRADRSRDIAPEYMHAAVYFSPRESRLIRQSYLRWHEIDVIAWKLGRSRTAVLTELTRQRVRFDGSICVKRRGIKNVGVSRAFLKCKAAVEARRDLVRPNSPGSHELRQVLLAPVRALSQVLRIPVNDGPTAILRTMADLQLPRVSLDDQYDLALRLGAPRFAYLLALQIRSPSKGLVALTQANAKRPFLQKVEQALDAYLRHVVDRDLADYYSRWRQLAFMRLRSSSGVSYRPACPAGLRDAFRAAVVRFLGGWNDGFRVLDLGLQAATDPEQALKDLVPFVNRSDRLAGWIAHQLISDGIGLAAGGLAFDATEAYWTDAKLMDPDLEAAALICRATESGRTDGRAALELGESMKRRLTRKPPSTGPQNHLRWESG